MRASTLGTLLIICSLMAAVTAVSTVDGESLVIEDVSDNAVDLTDVSDNDLIDIVDTEDTAAEEEDAESEAEAEAESESEGSSLLESGSSFGPFQAAANVMPYNMAVDPGHNFMNPFIRGYNPAYDGYTPQPGGRLWNNPNGPNWSPFHWSAPPSYWSVYPPQYASHYVSPHIYHAPPMHQFFGPYYNGQHHHYHSPSAVHPYGSMDPHIYGPHLDWPFGALTSDMDHIPGMGTGVNTKLAFPQFIEMEADSQNEDSEEDGFEGTDSDQVDANSQTVVDSSQFEVDSHNKVIPLKSMCVNCQYTDY